VTNPSAATPRIEPPRTVPTLERLTNVNAMISSPALSSDARMFVYVSDRGEEGTAPQVWVQQVGGGAIRLTSGQRECADCVFSADDTHVFFTAKGDTTLNIYDIPTLGGEPRLVKRNAKAGRCSPDGRWLTYISLDPRRQLRLASLGGPEERTAAPDLVDVASVAWSPDSRYLLAWARPDETVEPDYWIVPVDGGPPVNTGIILQIRRRGAAFPYWAPAWTTGAVIYTAATREGQMLWRQRLIPEPLQIIGEPEPLTRATEWAYFPTAAAGRLAFVSGHPDINLWSMPLDSARGTASGPPERATRGLGIMACLSTTSDGRMLAYFSTRPAKPEMFLRNMETGVETIIASAPGDIVNVFPALSPSGRQLAYGMMIPGQRPMRPLFVHDVAASSSRQVCDDCGARARQWIDERDLVLETFGASLSKIVLMDTTSGLQRELLASADRSVTNPRVSVDGHYIAFEAAGPVGSLRVYVAPFTRSTIPESDWIEVADNASHPFWSRDGRVLYYLPTIPHRDMRSFVYARRLDAESGRPEGEPFVAAALKDAMIPVLSPGTTPIIAGDQIAVVLADVRGDIWMMDV
jgi:Tol biopolymer transport system component